MRADGTEIFSIPFLIVFVLMIVLFDDDEQNYTIPASSTEVVTQEEAPVFSGTPEQQIAQILGSSRCNNGKACCIFTYEETVTVRKWDHVYIARDEAIKSFELPGHHLPEQLSNFGCVREHPCMAIDKPDEKRADGESTHLPIKLINGPKDLLIYLDVTEVKTQ